MKTQLTSTQDLFPPAPVLALLVVLIPSFASAQTFDIQEQHMELDITTSSTSLILDATFEVTAGLDELVLYEPGLMISHVSVDGNEASTQPYPGYEGLLVSLDLAEPLVAGTVATLHLEAAGTFDCASDQIPGATTCVRSETLTLLPGINPGSGWYLRNLFDVDPFVGEVVVHAPTALTVRAGQGPASEVIDDGDGTQTWVFPFEHATELVGVYAGEVEVVTAAEGYPVVGHVRDDEVLVAKMQEAVDLGGQVIPVLEGFLGEMPLSEASFTAAPPTMEWAGLGLLGNIFYAEYVFTDFDFLLEQGVAHELGHAWWGGLASASATPGEGGFLQEAFAEYSAWRALGELWGDDARTSGVRMSAIWYLFDRPSDVAPLDPAVQQSPAYVHATYHKGSVVIRTLESVVGEDDFALALQLFLDRGPGGLTVAGLIDDIEAVSGRQVGGIVDDFLRRQGAPVLTVEHLTDEDGAQLEGAELRVTVAGNFSFPLPVRTTQADGTQKTELFDIVPGEQTLELTAAEPLLIEIDPRWTSVRLVEPVLTGDVSLDGVVDGIDLLEVALRQGGAVPTQRRRDGHYDPLYDLDGDELIGPSDAAALVAAAHE